MAAEGQMMNPDKSVQIVLIGASGSGKSASGNTILGKKHFKTEASGKSVTVSCARKAEFINGWKVTVVDTPGWDCTELPESDVKSQISKTLEDLQGPYSFLLVLSVGAVESKDIRKIYGLQNCLGCSYLDHTTILFSHSDNLELKTSEEFLSEGDEEFKELLRKCSNRCYFWNNRDKRSDEDVEKILQDLKKTEKEEILFPNKRPRKDEEPSSSLNDCDEKGNNVTAEKKSQELITMDTQISYQNITVLFLGMTKVGKTSSIKTIVGKCDENAGALNYTCSKSGLKLRLIESPGFDESPEQIQKAISKSLSDCAPGPHVIILVMTIGRFSPATKRMMKHVQGSLGSNGSKHTMILFTGKDDLKGKSIITYVSENQDLAELVNFCESKFHAFNNRNISDRTQVEELLQKISEIYKRNAGRFYTNEGPHPDSNQHEGNVIQNFLTFHQCATVAEEAQMKIPDKSVQIFKGIDNKVPRMDEEPSSSFINCDEKGNDLVIKRKSQESVTMDAQTSSQNIRVLFLEMSKVGKTSIIKTIVGKCDENAGALNYTCPKSGQNLKLIESPGFDESPEQIQKAISKSLSDCAPGPHVIILVMSKGHFSPAINRIMKHVQDSLGCNGSKHTMILFTREDDMEGKPITTYINENQDLSELVKFCGGKFHAFNNRNISDRTQVEELLQKISEICERNTGGFYTNEGRHPDSNEHKGKQSQKRSGCPCILW